MYSLTPHGKCVDAKRKKQPAISFLRDPHKDGDLLRRLQKLLRVGARRANQFDLQLTKNKTMLNTRIY
jgi:hypothetical protein